MHLFKDDGWWEEKEEAYNYFSLALFRAQCAVSFMDGMIGVWRVIG